jgi:phage RecT family recombinase
MTTDTKLATQDKKISPIDAVILDVMETLRKRDARLELMLPEGSNVSRFKESVRFALAQNEDLVKCTAQSLVLAVMRGARVGLPVDGSGGYAYLVPFNKKIKGKNGAQDTWVKEAVYVPGYKGFCVLAVATRLVQDMQPVLVREKDLFEPEEGDSPRIIHRPYVPRKAGDTAGPVIAAYTRVLLPSGERVVKGLLYLPDLERIAASAPAKGGPRSGPHESEMQKKDTIKNAFKSMGVPPGDVHKALRLALAADVAAETGEMDPELASLEEDRKTSAKERFRETLLKRADEAPPSAEPLLVERTSTESLEPSPEEQAEILRQEMDAAKQ